MSETSIRRLAVGDIATFRAMNAMFGTAFDDTATHEGAPSGDFYVDSLLADPGIVMLAAFVETEVIGGLVAYELRKYERERSEFYIYDLAVAEPHRRQGIATDLIEALKPIAAARGGYVIFVQADHGDDPAIALYTKLGARENVLHFDIDTGAPDPRIYDQPPGLIRPKAIRTSAVAISIQPG